MIKGKLSMFIVFSLIIALMGTGGVFLAINMSKAHSVNKEKLEFIIEKSSKEYDGTPLELDDILLDEKSKLPKGYTYDFNCNDTITNVGKIYPNPTIIIYDKDNNNVTNSYDCVIKENGGLEVTASPITVKFESNTKVYDGTPLKETSFSVTSGELVFGHRIAPIYKSEASSIDEGEVDIEADIRVLDINGNDVTKNYEITDNLSGDNIPTFVITGRLLKIKLGTIEKEYDGVGIGKEDISETDYICEGLDTEKDHRVIINDFTMDDEIIECGTYDFTISKDEIEVIDSLGRSVINEYEVVVVKGKIKINPRTITLTEPYKKQIPYDGQSHRLELSSDELNNLLSDKDRTALGSSRIVSLKIIMQAGEITR